MGHYLYAVQDASDQALAYFERAAEQAERDLREALAFQIKCLVELGEIDRADEVLTNARQRFPGDPELDDHDVGEMKSPGS